MLHNQAPQLKNTMDFLWMEYTDIRYMDITTCIDSVSARAGELGDGLVSKWIVEERQSHAYIISTQLKHNWLLVMGIHWHQVRDIPTCIDLWVPEQHKLGDGWSLKWIVWGRAVSCLHNQAPNLNTIDSCDGIHWHQVQWHYYLYWFCECQSWRTGGRMVSKWIVWEGEQNHIHVGIHCTDVQCIHHKESIRVSIGCLITKHETVLSLNTIHLRDHRVPQFSSSGTHRINTSSNVHCTWCQCIPSQGVNLCLRLGAWLCSMRLLSPTQFIWRPSVPSCAALALTESIHVGMSLYLMSVFHHTGRQLCFQLGAWLCKHETALPHTHSFGDHPVPSPPALALTESITSSNVHCTWCQCISITRSPIVFQWCLLCKHETALPHTIYWNHPSPVLQLWHSPESIQVVMSLYLMSVYSIARSQLCFNWVLELCKHETALPHTIHLETIRPPVSPRSGTHRIKHVGMSLYLMSVVFHHKEPIVFQLGAWLVSDETALPSHNSFGDHPSSSCAPLALTESIHVSNVTVLISVYSITRSQLFFNWVLDYVSMRLLSLTQFIWRPSVPQFSSSATHRSIHVGMSLVPDVSVFHHKEPIVFQLRCLII